MILVKLSSDNFECWQMISNYGKGVIKIKFKKILATALVCSIALSYPVYAVEYSSIYDLSNKVKMSSGISYEGIRRLTSLGWMNINVVRANLKDEYTHTKPLYNVNGTSKGTSLSSMMKNFGAVAGINGDFFYMENPMQPYGPIISEGEVIGSPLYGYDKYPTISLDKNGGVDISVWNPAISVKNSSGAITNVAFINKGASIKYNTVILNSYYGEKSIGKSKNQDIVEIVVKDNIVTEIRDNMDATSIPKDGYIIVCASANKNEVKNAFKVGESVELTFKFDFDINNLQWAVGGVNHLVKDGVVNKIHDGVLGRHPRTAVGFNKDNTEIIFVTIDGRNKNYVGVTQTELAKIMIDLGAYNVINLDGGGSTTMGVDFLKNGNIEVVNFPSDGRERSIVSGLGIFDTAPESDVVDTIELNPEYDKIFKNTGIALNVKGFNKYYSPVDISDKTIKYTFDETKGEIVDNKFIPSVPGVVEITAKIGDIESTAKITVLDEPVTLSFEQDTLILEAGEKYEFKNIIGVDKNGDSAYISADNLTWSYRNSVGRVENGIFTANDVTNTGALTAICGNAVKHIIVKVGYKAQTIFSFENEDLKNLNFSTYPENSKGGIELSEDIYKEKYASIKLSYDFTNMTDQSIAFVDFGKNSEGLLVKGTPKAIGMWVYGDNSTHWLRTRVQDSSGKVHKIDFAEEVDWEGWKWVTAKLPEDIAYPVTVKNVYLAEINETKKDTGAIYIDSLRALYEPNDKDLKLREESVFNDELRVESVNDFAHKLSLIDGVINLETKDKIKIDAPISLSINIKNGSINYEDIKLWDKIKALSSYNNQNIVISLNYDINKITDDREKEVISIILEQTAANNNVFVVNKDDTENTIIKNGIRYIQYDDSFELYVNKDGVFYKN